MRNSPPTVTYGNGPAVYVTLSAGQWGTLSSTVQVIFGSSAAGGHRVLNDHVVTNTLNSIAVIGSAQSTAYGLIDICLPAIANVTVTNGIDLSHGFLALGSANRRNLDSGRAEHYRQSAARWKRQVAAILLIPSF